MGIFDSIMDSVKDQVGGEGAEKGAAAGAVMEMIKGGKGGLSGLVSSLSQGGLSGKVDSWVGTGDNEDVSGEEVEGALGASTIGKIAEQLGVDKSQASGLLASVLPKIIDQLTPQGKVADGE